MIREYLKNNILITDGAMGTYYAEITGKYSAVPEMANIDAPEIIERIHNEYIAAGAKLIKTNTFSANSITLEIPRTEIEKLLVAGVEIANRAVKDKNVFVAASIGPIPDMAGQTDLDQAAVIEEYKFIADVFLKKNIKIFFFETFSELVYLEKITEYIKAKDDSVFIAAQFATTPEGFTRKGISIRRIIDKLKINESIDAYGFNCGVGPAHLFHALKNIAFGNDIIAVSPNAGYPEIIHERTVYVNNISYFAERMKEISELGVKILGGCCGTTPAHIEKMANLIKPEHTVVIAKREIVTQSVVPREKKNEDDFSRKITNNQFVIAVELDPPFNADTEMIMKNSWICKQNGVDVITLADSPMGRARVDSIMLAAKIKREVGIEVIPHICCRDKNINALKSSVLAGYIENIRNVLAVTGDPVPMADKNDIKGVFNINSFKLIELLATMNKEIFAEDPIRIGGALNLNAAKPEEELVRMQKKVEMGAELFLTQPIFDERASSFLPQTKRNENIRVLGGIMPLVSYRNAQFLNNEVAGIQIPEKIVNQFTPFMDKEEAETLGVEIAVDIANRIKKDVHGFYFITPFNRVEMIIKIIKKLGLQPLSLS